MKIVIDLKMTQSGEIKGKMRMGNDTLEDRQEINKHFQKSSERNNIPTEATAVCISK